jgi:hypothetical protein
MGTPSSPAASAAPANQLDIVFDGTWVFAPQVDPTGKITAVNIYSPACGHPHGAYFTTSINPNPWPQPSAFYQLDDHSHVVLIEANPGSPGMNISGIDQTINHCVKNGRPIGGNWDLMVTINGGPDAWVSTDTVTPQTTDTSGRTVPCFQGDDSPTGKVSSLQTLTFHNIKSLQLCGAPAKVQGLLPNNPWTGISGTLIFEGEVPYIPTLQHEREGINAMANLAGLDLTLNYPLPSSQSQQQPAPVLRPTLHSGGSCGHGVILTN